MDDLTKRQEEILRFVCDKADNGLPPTHREIAEHFGLHQHGSGVRCHLRAIERKGYITRRGTRAITVYRRPGETEFAARLRRWPATLTTASGDTLQRQHVRER